MAPKDQKETWYVVKIFKLMSVDFLLLNLRKFLHIAKYIFQTSWVKTDLWMIFNN